MCCGGGANGAAVDPGGSDTNEELAIEAGVARESRARAHLPIEIHDAGGLMIIDQAFWQWTISDLAAILTVRSGNVQTRGQPGPQTSN